VSLTNAISSRADQVEALGVLYEDSFSQAPKPQDAADYNETVDAFEFVVDFSQSTVPFFPGGGLPRILVLDTTTMEIVYKADHYQEAEILAAVNAI
jgi:hypothetical protein